MNRYTTRHSQAEGALAVAINQSDWERAALLLFVAFARTLQQLPPGTIDDLLDILEGEEERDAKVRS